LRYLRAIPGKAIAARSVTEIQRQGVQDPAVLAQWQAQMATIFPDVQEGTVLSAIFFPEGKTLFFAGDTPIGSIQDADFTRAFPAIWLGPHTAAPLLRQRLLGLP
jgi:hypothetical protein